MRQTAFPWILGLLRRILPARHLVVVNGFPATESNAAEMVRGLLERYGGDVHWIDPPSSAYLDLIGIDAGDSRLHLHEKYSLPAVLAYLTSEAVFFTHGLYGVPNSVPRKPTINLWHGAGMKPPTNGTLFPGRRLRGRPNDFVVVPTILWGKPCATAAQLPFSAMLATGYPRNRLLREPLTSSLLESLKISPETPFVVWMPSYRTSRTVGRTRGRSDLASGVPARTLVDEFNVIATKLTRAGIQVVVKPHPLDAENISIESALVITDEALERAGAPLYRLLASSSGLISDVSSVWPDYLTADKPLAFFFPDVDEYAKGRGIYPANTMEWLPGPLLEDLAAVTSFISDIHAKGRETSALRNNVKERIGLIEYTDSADRILDSIVQHGGTSFARHIASSTPACNRGANAV